MTKISVHENGPYLVRGTAELLDKEGRRFKVPEKGFALCRCGQSNNKPFCDGSHSRVCFRAPSLAKVDEPDF